MEVINFDELSFAIITRMGALGLTALFRQLIFGEGKGFAGQPLAV